MLCPDARRRLCLSDDAEVNIFYNYFRDYDPERGTATVLSLPEAQDESYARITGCYVESDPIGLDGGLNTYGYVGGDALHFIDPEGLTSPGNHKLDMEQIKRIEEQLKDPNLDKKTRNELKRKLTQNAKARGKKHSRMSKDKILRMSFLPLILACEADPCSLICRNVGMGDSCENNDNLIACQN